MEEYLTYGYYGLFSISFLAATILPISSEIVFVALLATDFNPTLLLLSATFGNWIGGMTNYYLGYLGKIEWIEKYFHIPLEKIQNIKEKIYNKGAFMAFFFTSSLFSIPKAVIESNNTFFAIGAATVPPY